MSESVALDFSKLRKGSKVKHADGRTLTVSGIFMSSDGPALMVKQSPTDATGQNVPFSNILEILED
mgnify:CR=1 FL=1